MFQSFRVYKAFKKIREVPFRTYTYGAGGTRTQDRQTARPPHGPPLQVDPEKSA